MYLCNVGHVYLAVGYMIVSVLCYMSIILCSFNIVIAIIIMIIIGTINITPLAENTAIFMFSLLYRTSQRTSMES